MELLVPGAKKIELFARNNNLRPGWLRLVALLNLPGIQELIKLILVF